MNRRRLLRLACAAMPLFPTSGRAAPAARVRAEVDALLAGVEASGCSFYRNGSWHGAQAAAAHLRDKYDYLAARDLIVTTEDFIDKAATRSSMSSADYQVKCGAGDAVASSRWLRDRLGLLRRP